MVHLTGLEEVGREAGRTVFGNYVLIPPGPTRLVYSWTSKGMVASEGEDSVYRLTIQRQPGTTDEPIAITIQVPKGAHILEASGGLLVRGQTVTLNSSIAGDLQVEIRYR